MIPALLLSIGISFGASAPDQPSKPSKEQFEAARTAVEKLGGDKNEASDWRSVKITIENAATVKITIENAADEQLKAFPTIPFLFELDLSGPKSGPGSGNNSRLPSSKVTDTGMKRVANLD